MIRIVLLVLLVVVILCVLLFIYFIVKAPDYTEKEDGSMKPEVKQKKQSKG